MAIEPENQTGNGAGIVVDKRNDLSVERGKAAYRAKASRFFNCQTYRRSTQCRSRIYNWQYLAEAKGKRESRTKGNCAPCQALRE